MFIGLNMSKDVTIKNLSEGLNAYQILAHYHLILNDYFTSNVINLIKVLINYV